MREPSDPWIWVGPEAVVEGRTWGGRIEVLGQIALADRKLLETSEETPFPEDVKRWVRGSSQAFSSPVHQSAPPIVRSQARTSANDYGPLNA
ncbi:hypothetical protein [Arthrobacter sp. Z4-13]